MLPSAFVCWYLFTAPLMAAPGAPLIFPAVADVALEPPEAGIDHRCNPKLPSPDISPRAMSGTFIMM